MPLADDDARALLRALEDALLKAGYAAAADQIRRVASEPLHPDELDDQSYEGAAISILEADLGGSDSDENEEGELAEDVMLENPTPRDRVAAAIKIIDLMVTEPLRIERHLPRMWSRVRVEISELRVGEESAQLSFGRRPAAEATAALAAWDVVLSDLREVVAV